MPSFLFCLREWVCCGSTLSIINNAMSLTVNQKERRRIYLRWSQMVSRCNNPNNSDYKYYGEQGYKVGGEWNRENPAGFENFLAWFLEECRHRTDPQATNVGLRDKTKVYCPENCVLINRSDLVQKGSAVTLTPEQVVAMRAMKRRKPELLMKEILAALQLRVSLPVACNALYGNTFKNLDLIEPPFQRA